MDKEKRKNGAPGHFITRRRVFLALKITGVVLEVVVIGGYMLLNIASPYIYAYYMNLPHCTLGGNS